MASPWVEFSKAQAIMAGGTGTVSFMLVDADDAPINVAAITSATATLQDVGRGGTGRIINGVQGVSVLGANGGTVVGSTFTMVLDPADTALVVGSSPREYQRRLLTVTFTYTDGTAVIPVSFWVRDPVASVAHD
jgi:hypothetical protein